MKLIYSNGEGHIENSTGAWEISSLPNFSIPCDGIFYHPENGIALKYQGLGRTGLSVDECAEVGSYIASLTKPVDVPLTLAQLRPSKSAEISQACQDFILAGYKSSALGGEHTYPNNDRDQVNLSGTILRSTLPLSSPDEKYLFLCADAEGYWGYRLHTAGQIQTVGADSYNFILSARVKNATLQYQIMMASSIDQLSTLSW